MLCFSRPRVHIPTWQWMSKALYRTWNILSLTPTLTSSIVFSKQSETSDKSSPKTGSSFYITYNVHSSHFTSFRKSWICQTSPFETDPEVTHSIQPITKYCALCLLPWFTVEFHVSVNVVMTQIQRVVLLLQPVVGGRHSKSVGYE